MKKFWQKDFWVKRSQERNPLVAAKNITNSSITPITTQVFSSPDQLISARLINDAYMKILSSNFQQPPVHLYLSFPNPPKKNKKMPPNNPQNNAPDPCETYKRGDKVLDVSGNECYVVSIHPTDPGVYLLEESNLETFDEGWERDQDVPQDYVSIGNNTYTYEYVTNMKLVEQATPQKPIEIDLTHLEPLVLKEESKKAIMSVLKQHNHQKKIFEDWGMDEVLEYGKGMTFLFYGPPGTGKTRAAGCIAKACGTTLLTIGAAEIQTSEPGGANRNIQEAFATAKKKKQVLFIDECDSLITNRAEVGMVLSSEINTLLTEIERFEGVCILATNIIEHLDAALERRISLIVEFPKPDFNDRVKIWQTLIPKKLPLDPKFNVKKIAEYSLTGGQIKNAILSGVRYAASEEHKQVTQDHFETAIKQILKNSGLMGKDRRQTVHLDVHRESGSEKSRTKTTAKTNA